MGRLGYIAVLLAASGCNCGQRVCQSPAAANLVVTTVAGTGPGLGCGGPNPASDGPVSSAQLSRPGILRFDGAGRRLFFADAASAVRVLDLAQGTVTTLAGGPDGGYSDGKGAAAAFVAITGLAVGDGGLFVSDGWRNDRIRFVGFDGTVTTVAGHGLLFADAGFGAPLAVVDAGWPPPAPALQADLEGLSGVLLAASGALFFAAGNQVLSFDGSDVTVVAGSGASGDTDGLAGSATFSDPIVIAADPKGGLLVLEGDGNLRAIDADGGVSSVGLDAPYNAPYQPYDVAVAPTGDAYIVGGLANGVWRVTPSGHVSLVAGTGKEPTGDVDGPALQAEFHWPTGIALDCEGNLYVSDSCNGKIREIHAGP